MEDQGEATSRPRGTTSIAPGVLLTIARLTALSVPGVAGLATTSGGVSRLFRRREEGIRLEVDNNRVAVELHLLLEQDTNLRQVSRKVQADVARAIEDMVGMQVERIDVHIEDISYRDTTR